MALGVEFEEEKIGSFDGVGTIRPKQRPGSPQRVFTGVDSSGHIVSAARSPGGLSANTTGMTRWLITKGIVKSERGAQVILIFVVIVNIVITFIVIKFFL